MLSFVLGTRLFAFVGERQQSCQKNGTSGSADSGSRFDLYEFVLS